MTLGELGGSYKRRGSARMPRRGWRWFLWAEKWKDFTPAPPSFSSSSLMDCKA